MISNQNKKQKNNPQKKTSNDCMGITHTTEHCRGIASSADCSRFAWWVQTLNNSWICAWVCVPAVLHRCTVVRRVRKASLDRPLHPTVLRPQNLVCGDQHMQLTWHKLGREANKATCTSIQSVRGRYCLYYLALLAVTEARRQPAHGWMDYYHGADKTTVKIHPSSDS